MADDTTSSSPQLPIDNEPNWTYRPLGLPSLASPGPALPGHKSTIDTAAQRRQAAADYNAKEAAHQAKSNAQARKDAAPTRGKRGK